MRSMFMRAAVSMVALVALGATGVALSTGDTTDRPAAIADDPGPDPLAADRATRIPTAIAPQARHGCGTLPVAFDDPVAGYSLCYPSGFGFLVLTERAPRGDLDAIEAASVRLASATAFPWEPGTLPLDAVAAGATIIEITTLPAFTPSPEGGDCTPDQALGAARVCELRLDPMSASPDATGAVVELLAVADLANRVAVVRAYLPDDASGDARDQVRAILATLRALAVEDAR
jgi:hypothetical protein